MDELRKTASSEPEQRAQKQLFDFYRDALELPFGPRVAWDTLATVFLNVAVRALGKDEAIASLRRMADWLESNDTRRPPH
jgi:hypothetical protein